MRRFLYSINVDRNLSFWLVNILIIYHISRLRRKTVANGKSCSNWGCSMVWIHWHTNVVNTWRIRYYRGPLQWNQWNLRGQRLDIRTVYQVIFPSLKKIVSMGLEFYPHLSISSATANWLHVLLMLLNSGTDERTGEKWLLKLSHVRLPALPKGH